MPEEKLTNIEGGRRSVSSYGERRVRSDRFRYVISLLVFRLILDLSYLTFVSPKYSEHHLSQLKTIFEPTQYILSVALFLMGVSFVPFSKKNFGGIFFLTAILFVYAPLTSVYGLDGSRSMLPVLYTAVALLVTWLVSVSFFPRVRFPIVANGKRIVFWMAFILTAIVFSWSIISGATSYFSLNVSEVYVYRRDVGAILDVGPMAYLNPWVQKVINPTILCMAMFSRRWMLAAISACLQVYFFGVTSQRSLMFVPVMCFGMWYFYNSAISIARLVWYASTLVIVVLLLTRFLGYEELGAITIRRAFFVPAGAVFEWFAYFEIHERVFWTDNFLAALWPSQYSGESVPYIVGRYLNMGREGLSYNIGLVGSANAHAGLFGVVLYSVILGIVLRLINVVILQGAPAWLAAAILIVPIRIVWADSDLFSALLTHGVIIGIVLLWLYGSSSQVTKRSP
jgi:hypothetical protein